MTLAWLGIGGNVGDVRANMVAALQYIDAQPSAGVRRVSALYETPPWGLTEQPIFLNSCAEIETDLDPERLLDLCLSAERSLKRIRRERWGPRTIDIDILAMQGVRHRSPTLNVPHSRLTERAFALLPFNDLAPDHLLEGKRAEQWLADLSIKGIKKISEADEWGQAIWR